METVQESVSLPKQAQDVRVLIVNLVKGVVAKKSAAELAAAELPDLMKAIDGFDQLADEAKSPEMFNLAGLLAADLAKVLTGKA